MARRFGAEDAGSLRGWHCYSVGRGWIERRVDGLRLLIDDAEATTLADAQLDDYHGHGRTNLPWSPPLRLTVRARWSHALAELRGTTGFGFWNDPIDAGGRFAAAPSHLWFFHASAPSRIGANAAPPGLLGGVGMRGGRVPGPLLWAGSLALRVPLLRGAAVRAGERRVGSGAVRAPAGLDATVWHTFELTWSPAGAAFGIDGVEVGRLGAEATPDGPLGFVAWIDNNWAVGDGGDYRAGRLDAPGRQWLDLAEVRIERPRR